MENAVDALKMAAAILIFIIAIGSSFSVIGLAKETADSIITMRDKQKYLESAKLDDGILYTSASSIQGETGLTEEEIQSTFGVTTYGDRIVSIEDIYSTIYRYAIENYSVTIIDKNGKVIARYDTSLESYIRNYYTYGTEASTVFNAYQEKITENNNLKTEYCESITFPSNKIEELYKMKNGTYNAPWLGSRENINKRINADITGKEVTIYGVEYKGVNLSEELHGETIVEVVNEIDESKYLVDGDEETNLLQQYEMPTIEIIYVILD